MRTLLSLSVAVLAGLLMTRVAKPLKLPSVTAYLVAGVLIGPYCLGLLGIEGLGFPTQEAVDSLSLISEVALGFIAFSIGSEFRVSELKHTGKQAFVIGVLQALTATFVVDIALVAISLATGGKLSIAQAITLGAIATATAPAKNTYSQREMPVIFQRKNYAKSLSRRSASPGKTPPHRRKKIIRLRGHEDELPGANPSPGWSR